MSKGEAKRKAAACEAPLGFEPRISCLQDRRFDQLSHGAPSLRRVSPGQLSSAAAEGWFASQPAHCTPVCVLFSERKATLPKELSHGARLFRFVRLGRYPSKAGEGVASQGKPPAVLTLLRVPTRRPFLKKRLLGRIEARDQRHRWDSNPGSPVY
ncbi:hypothetical protein Q8A67_018555 [Cirrhinus molitorella]|uniref:Uncharacterized protein n=1 Tax=Cirrhinus molitorella TaxID=172907 RepID=A0AA88PGJ8_9TELE|nr:hypothetical protein Q8A67_018555 [Cirrhinus molitorella]